MAKASTKKTAAKRPTANEGKMDPQSGQVSGESPARAKKEAADKFAAADAKGDPNVPTPEELEAIRVQQQVRGF